MQVSVRIEIPKNDDKKYEIDPITGELIVSRILHTPMKYPFNYGSFPHTLSLDGDETDAVVITESSLFPGSKIECKIIGVLITEDEEGDDEKIICVPIQKVDPKKGTINDISELNTAETDSIKFFFENYKRLEPNKWVKVKDMLGALDAQKIYLRSMIRFLQKEHPILELVEFKLPGESKDTPPVISESSRDD